METGNQAEFKLELFTELYRTLEILGAKSELLGVIGSASDGDFNAQEVLEELKVWNAIYGSKSHSFSNPIYCTHNEED